MKLKQLKVRPKKLLEASPCIVEMGAMLECWSRAGVDDPRCAQTAKALATCMSKPVSYSTTNLNIMISLKVLTVYNADQEEQIYQHNQLPFGSIGKATLSCQITTLKPFQYLG